MTKQQFFAPALRPWGTTTSRLTSPLLSVLPQRVRRPEEKLGFAFQYTLAFPEDSEYTLMFFDHASQL